MAWIGALWLTGCAVDEPDGAGIAVGNPPGSEAEARVTVADGDDVYMNAFALEVDAVYLENCEGFGRILDVDPPAFIGLRGSRVRVPAGVWCGIGLLPTDRPAELAGVAGEGRFRFEGPLGRILLYSEAGTEVSEGDPFVLELAEPGWIASTDFGVRPGQLLEIGGPDCVDDPLCSRIRAGLMNRAGLYRDANGDGEVDQQERARGTDASGDGRRSRD